MSANGISTETVLVSGNIDPVATKLKRRDDKLALAQTKRQSLTTSTWYRSLNVLSTLTHVAFVSTSTATVSGTASPVIGHPWTTGI